ncbi:MAG: two-component system sensor histidine kinase NtrB [Acidimicrobiales bacterium]
MLSRGDVIDLVDIAPFAVLVTDVDANVRSINPFLSEALGLVGEETIGAGLGDLSPEMDRALGPIIRQASDGDALVVRESVAVIPGVLAGTVSAFRTRSRNDDLDVVVTTIMGSGAPDESQRTHLTYQMLFDNAPIAYYNVGLDGTLIRWNKALEDLFGLSGAEIRGRHITEFFAPESIPKVQELFGRFSQGLGWQNEELTFLRGDGSRAHVLATVTPLIDDDGNVVESLSMEVDITELREAQDRMMGMQQELIVNERLAAIGQLTATVSHELRNPLGAVRSASDALKRLVDAKSPRVERAFALLERSQVRCDRIIEDLLNYTRMRELELTSTGVDDWIASLLDEYGFNPTVIVKRDLQSGSELLIDRDRMEQAVRNVLDNASQAMDNPDKGAQTENLLVVETSSRPGRVEITFVDAGPGIAPDDAARVLEPLYTTKSFGIGLGLPIVKQIMEQHGGGIDLNSEFGHGTTVTLWIPSTINESAA